MVGIHASGKYVKLTWLQSLDYHCHSDHNFILLLMPSSISIRQTRLYKGGWKATTMGRIGYYLL